MIMPLRNPIFSYLGLPNHTIPDLLLILLLPLQDTRITDFKKGFQSLRNTPCASVIDHIWIHIYTVEFLGRVSNQSTFSERPCLQGSLLL